MLKLYSLTILLVISNFSNGQLQIQKINDSCYFEIKELSANKCQITKFQNNFKIYQTIIKDTTQLKNLNLYPLNEYYYESVPFIKEQIVFYYKNGKISKEINFKRKRNHFYSQIEVKKHDTSGLLKHYSFNINKRFGKNYYLYSDYKNGNLISENKSSYYNFKYRKIYLEKAYMIDSFKNKYTLVKNCWSDYPTYQMNNSNIYFIEGWKVKLTKTEIKNEYILTHYTEFNKKHLSQKFIQISKKKQTFRNDDQLWSYLKNSTDTFFNDSGEVDYIQRFSKKGNLVYYKSFNSNKFKYGNFYSNYIIKNHDTLVINQEIYSSKIIIYKVKSKYLIKEYYSDTLVRQIEFNNKTNSNFNVENGKFLLIEKTKTDNFLYYLLNNYFEDKEHIDLDFLLEYF